MFILIKDFHPLPEPHNPRLTYGLRFTTIRDETSGDRAFMYAGDRLIHARKVISEWCAGHLGTEEEDWELSPFRHVIWLRDPTHAALIRLIWHKARISDPPYP
ncbi:MAG: hypothetical protein EOP83_05145 [Verrucomicrobiaceae bacterium]|nr:MAG: hypothetical protein EOP83_05145 [Verrucomicrobiaceae bacterium]